MSDKSSAAITRAALRASQQPFFLANIFAAYQTAHDLDDQALARQLGCDVHQLPHLALCRRPREDAEAFAADIDHLANRFHFDGVQLAMIVRQVDALQALRQHLAANEQGAGLLRAARDRDEATSSREESEQPGEENGHD